MGPPPSPKEPRRSGRRSVPSASSSKSPAGSPTSDTSAPPKSKENKDTSRHPLPASHSSGRHKKPKHEDVDEGQEVLSKSSSNGATNGRNKRKGKEREKGPLAIDIPDDQLSSILEPIDGNADPNAGEEDEAGITRCICDGAGARPCHSYFGTLIYSPYPIMSCV